jgi:hypothetical protein
MAEKVTKRLREISDIVDVVETWEMAVKEDSMTWHSVLSGKEECRKNGAWDLTICQSKERALDQARALLLWPQWREMHRIRHA